MVAVPAGQRSLHAQGCVSSTLSEKPRLAAASGAFLKKRELFDRLAQHYRILAEVE